MLLLRKENQKSQRQTQRSEYENCVVAGAQDQNLKYVQTEK